VTHADCDNAAEEVEIALAVRVPDVLVFALGNDQGVLEQVKDGREEELLAG
jgi:hypothetical protein